MTLDTLSRPYLVESMLPTQEVSLLAGASGAGKSTLVFQMLAAIINGEHSFLDHEIHHPVRIAYIAADRTFRSYIELASRTKLDLRQMQICSLIDDEGIDVNRLERDSMNLLSGIIKRFDKPDLVVVDPLILFIGVDTNNYNKVAPRMIQLAKLCTQMKVTILGTHHASKARSDFSFQRAQDRINGSGALLGFTSTQMFLAAADELKKPYSEFAIVSHNAPAESIRLVRGDAGVFKPFEDLNVNQFFIRQVCEAATKAPVSKKQIQKITAMAPEMLDQILDHMLQEQLLITNHKGEYRTLGLTVKES